MMLLADAGVKLRCLFWGADQVLRCRTGSAEIQGNERRACGIYSSAEVMHGPLALVGPGFPVLSLSARDKAEQSSAEVADGLADKGASIFATTDRVTKAKRLPFAATGHPLTDPLSLITSFYAFVEAFARQRDYNPDQPRNLRKVTETV